MNIFAMFGLEQAVPSWVMNLCFNCLILLTPPHLQSGFPLYGWNSVQMKCYSLKVLSMIIDTLMIKSKIKKMEKQKQD